MVYTFLFLLLSIYTITYNLLFKEKKSFEYYLYSNSKIKHNIVKFITLVLNISFIFYLRYTVFGVFKFISNIKWIKK
jgi:hypothetical protein